MMFFKRRKNKDILVTQNLPNDPEYKAACLQREKHDKARMQLKKKKGKINVLFFVINESWWKYDSVYWKMSKRKRYNPVIFVCPQCDRGEVFKRQQQQNCFDFFKEGGYNVVNSFDEATGDYIDARSLSPDIIFYTSPYEGLIDERYYISNFSDVLTCYANYAFMNNDEKWAASLPLHKSVWKYFCEYDLTRHYNKVGTKLYYDNRVVVGYPMYDRFVDKSFVGSDWKQQDSSKKRIIYAPHHTIEKDGWIHYSTFLTTGEIMAELRDKYKDQVQFVFKPHPLLKAKLYNAEGWGREKTDAYYEAWANAENSSFVDNDYVDLFKSSDALIHDCGSFIVEYLYVQKPVMHLNTGQIKEELNAEAMEAYQAHYLMDKTEDIEMFITKVVLNGKDTKREARETVYRKLLIPPHHRLVADNILYEIDRELSTGIRKNMLQHKGSNMSSIQDVKLIELPRFNDPRGNLSFLEQNNHIPFEIKRTYWIYDVPGGGARGGHAFKQNQEFIVALSGAFDVVVDDGTRKKKFTLNRSYYGLYVPAGLWREMENFSTNSLALEFGSWHYDVCDYIRDFDEFLKLKGNGEI